MPSMPQTPLPVDEYAGAITDHLKAHRFAVVVAPPGTGKTTRIPPALSALGATILLQPRRVAARALARRIAAERGWTVGREVGWQIRFERRFTEETRLLVATEGILTARLASDPFLSGFRCAVLDEFHERSIHGDLALALVKQAALTRDDLAVVVMSATLDAGPVAAYLADGSGPARIFTIEGSRHPVRVFYRPSASVAAAVREMLFDAPGDVLAFLPGAREIEKTSGELADLDALVLPLHGSLDVESQERALAPAARRKVILATNIAETSLTVEGVTEVVDSGLHKVLRYDAAAGVDHLVTERIAADSAEQRAGRAGRTAPGRATRLWDSRDLLRPQRDPEIARADLASPVLDIVAWGGDPRTFDWFEPPSRERLQSALELLERLGAITAAAVPRLTGEGEKIRRLPLHPRLARLVVAAGNDVRAVRIAAALSEGVRLTRSETTPSDAFALADAAPDGVVRELTRIAGSGSGADEERLLRAILAAYPDRVARRREPRSDRLLLASGSGATLSRESGVRDGEFLVALDVAGTGAGEPLVRLASVIERGWLNPTKREKVHSVAEGRVRAVERAWYDAILLHEQSVAPDPEEARRLLRQGAADRVDPLLRRRAAFARIDVDWEALAEPGVDPAALLPWEVRSRLDKLAPVTIPLPSGRTARLDYREDGAVVAAVKLQELFGLGETPKIGPASTPVTFELLAPSGRPVQVTRDLRSFWNGTYAEVRKELRARYPKHPWPEDPWTAPATHRTRRR